MVAEPAATPVTAPVIEFTVAAEVLLLLQLPPPLPLLVKAVVEPTHNVPEPLTMPEFGSAFTLTSDEALVAPQVFTTVYVIVALPVPTPVTTPVAEFTVATRLLLLLQVPPLAPLLVNVVIEPAHNVDEPFMEPAFGMALMVILADEAELPHVLLTV